MHSQGLPSTDQTCQLLGLLRWDKMWLLPSAALEWGCGKEGAILPMVGSGRKRAQADAHQMGRGGRASWREGPKAGRRRGQGVWTLGWPTFLVTLAKTNVETLSMWGIGPEEPQTVALTPLMFCSGRWVLLNTQFYLKKIFNKNFIFNAFQLDLDLDLLPLSNPPLWVITEHWAELPVLDRSFPLAVYFGHVSAYMSVLFSQFVSPSLSFPVSTCPSNNIFLNSNMRTGARDGHETTESTLRKGKHVSWIQFSQFPGHSDRQKEKW